MNQKIAIAALCAAAGAASADFTIPTIAGPSAAAANGDFVLNLGDVPAGTYIGATISATFNDLGGARANEVRLGFGDSGVGSFVGNYSYTGGSSAIPSALIAPGDQNLNWQVDFALDFLGGVDNNLFFNGFSTFQGTWAFSDLSITLNTAPTLASLALGTLGPGASAVGDTRESTNDLAGGAFVSPFFPGSVNGNDDVWAVEWGGGDFEATLDVLSTTFPLLLPAELDLYLYDAADPADALAFTNAGNSGGDPDVLRVTDLAAGTYYLRVDGLFDSGAYNLSIVPAPGAAALLGLAGVACVRRRRA